MASGKSFSYEIAYTKAAEKFFTTHENRCIQKDDRSLSRSHRSSKDAPYLHKKRLRFKKKQSLSST